MKTLFISIVLVLISTLPIAGDWNSSPNNWQNSQNNWQNSSTKWKNSPNNWNNSRQNYGNDRIIRDNSGNATGYAVPKANGGVNLYDFRGNRTGYVPANRR